MADFFLPLIFFLPFFGVFCVLDFLVAGLKRESSPRTAALTVRFIYDTPAPPPPFFGG